MTVTTTSPTETQPGPYAAAALTYHRAGWSPLPLPARAKAPVPEGWTGARGATPSGADVFAWTEERGDGNIALRLPPNVLGVDVDSYDAKPGGLVLAQLETTLGALPPTWRATSRDDGHSGIRLYRIPEGLRWPGGLGPGIDTLRYDHRYAVVWPSIHPKTGGTYRWITPDGVVAATGIPTPDDLPDLPEAWVSHFTGGELSADQPHAGLDTRGALGWVQERSSHPGTCRRIDDALARGLTDLHSTHEGGRHDAALRLTNRLAWLAGEGHHGLTAALDTARGGFLTAVGSDRRPEDAAGEWDRMVVGAVDIAAAAHPVTPTTDPCDDPFAGLIPTTQEKPWQPPTSPSPSPSSSTSPSSSASPPPSSASPATPEAAASAATPGATSPTTTASGAPAAAPPTPERSDVPAVGDASREVATRLQAGGAFILDIPDKVPAIWGRGEEVLWASGEALTICGPAGVGKTTLTGQVLRARLVGGDVLGLPVEPTTTRVLYLAMDRPRQIARALRRTLGDIPRDILDQRLIVWPGPPIADVAAHPETLVGLVHLAGADTVIVDSIKDAAVGLSSDEVGAGYNRARQMCIAEGIEVLEQHHMVKKGENGAKPTSLADLYGSVWIGAGAGSVVLLHGAAGDPIVSMTHLKTPAEEVGPWRLIHDHAAGHTDIWHQSDLVAMARAAGFSGLTAKAVACSIAEKDNPSKAEVEKARRRLDKLAERGLLRRRDGAKGGSEGGQAASWVYVEPDPTNGLIAPDHGRQTDHETDHARDRVVIATTDHDRSRRGGVSAGQSDHGTDHGDHGGTDHDPTPPFKGGGSVGEASTKSRKTITRVIDGTAFVFDAVTRELLEEREVNDR